MKTSPLLPRGWWWTRKSGNGVLTALLLIVLLQLHLVTTVISDHHQQQQQQQDPSGGDRPKPPATSNSATVSTSSNNQKDDPTRPQASKTAEEQKAASSSSESNGSSEEQQRQYDQPETEQLSLDDNELSKELEELSTKTLLEQEVDTAKQYFYGEEADMNLNLSYQLFSDLAAKGNAEGHLYLAFMYSVGLGPVKANQAKALLHYTFAALGNSTFAQMALGYRYWSGVSVASSCEYALSYYRQAAAKVEAGVTFSGSPSIQRVRLLDELENPGSYNGVLDEDLIQYYQFLADKGDVQAQVGLGQLHFQGGRGVALDPQRAFHYFKLAAESGNTNAMAFLGKMYLEGNMVAEQDYDLAYKYFKMAAEKSNPVGQSGLGIMHLYGKGVERDFNLAFKYFSQASVQGWVDGQLYLGLMYLKGYSVSKDPKTAMKYFTLASQSGHILGFYNLAVMHADGLGAIRSCSTAVELFKSVSERGPWGSTLAEAHKDYKNGKRVDAFLKYAVLAELGYEVAQSNAAFMLDRGEVSQLFNTSETHARAFMYWSRSAAQGSSTARVKLGDYHYYGLGTKVDYELAANQYRIASEGQTNAQALFNLGYMYESGLGLRRDIYLAKRYYDLAAVTSVEAQVPVALALLKLFFVFAGEYLRSTPAELKVADLWAVVPETVLGQDWDLYVIAVLVTLVATILFFRRNAGRR